MPIYEYQCDACGHQLEVMQKITEDPLKTCPDCNVDSLQKLVSKVGFRLKGTGWYETDFKDKPKDKPKDKDDSKTDASGDGKKKTAGKDSSSSGTTGDSGAKSESKAAPTSDS
jgi:putative FmdB family regulatory protein